MLEVIRNLRTLLSRREKKIISGIIIASIFVSFLETFSISLVMVFASVATNYKSLFENKYYNFVYTFFNFKTPSNFVVIFGLLLIVFYFFRASIITLFTYIVTRFSQGRYKSFSYRFFQNYLNFNYKDFTSMDMVTINRFIFVDAGNLTSILNSLITIVSESMTVAFIYVSLIFVKWKLTLVLSCVLSLKVFFIIKTFSKKLAVAGENSEKLNIILGKTFGESFWNFKIIKLISNEGVILKKFEKAASGFVRSKVFNALLQTAPRLILETIGFSSLIFVIIYIVYMYDNAASIIPIISMYAFAFYRFLPSINKIVGSYNQILFVKHSLNSVQTHSMYNFEDLGNEKLKIQNSLFLDNISFEYKKNSKILNSISLEIKKGETIAFIGESGSGKSTIVDLIMGLYKPTSGNLFVDDLKINHLNVKSWRSLIGYIPQDIYLFNGTVAENVVFGREFNKNNLITVLKKANIYDFLLQKEGLNTIVGEAGIKLSGGQKQRIAIARALYSDPEILVLDEATSALDNETEAKIMDEIYNLNDDKTILVVAHRLSTIQRCDKIYKIENGKVYLVNNISEPYINTNKRTEAVF